MRSTAIRATVAVVVALAVGAPAVASASVMAAAPKKGQFCKAADIGKKSGKLKCSKDGTRARWK